MKRGEVIFSSNSWPPVRLPGDVLNDSTPVLMESLGIASRTDVTGVFALHSLGVRLRSRLVGVIAAAYSRHGFSQVQYPTLQSREIWELSGRWQVYESAKALFPVLDGDDASLCLAPTSEEVAVADAKRHLRSYRDLPARIWLTTSKFRNELSPRGALMRGREFEMADGYSFDPDAATSRESYELLGLACRDALREMGFTSVFESDADGGDISEGESSEFLVLGDSGQSSILACTYCGSRGDASSVARIADSEGVCANCGRGVLSELRAIELAHIFLLGQKYSSAMGLSIPTQSSEMITPLMACSGIGVTRCIQALADQCRDDRGFNWPYSVAPYDVHVLCLRPDLSDSLRTAENVATVCASLGVDVLLDDSDISSGQKFVYANCIGAPLQIVVSSRDLMNVELRDRSTQRSVTTPLADLSATLHSMISKRSDG